MTQQEESEVPEVLAQDTYQVPSSYITFITNRRSAATHTLNDKEELTLEHTLHVKLVNTIYN